MLADLVPLLDAAVYYAPLVGFLLLPLALLTDDERRTY